MRRVYLSLFFVLANGILTYSMPPVSDISASRYLDERGEVYFSFSVPDREVLDALLYAISFEGIRDGRVVAYANTSEFETFLLQALDYVVHIPPSLQLPEKNLNMRSSVDVNNVGTWDFYPTYEAYEDMMEQFALQFPELCELVNIKTLASGRALLFLKITGNNKGNHVRPRFMYTSTMHGDEPPGFNLMLRLIHYLLNGYNHIDEVTYLMDNLEIWVCPNENPDGTYTNNNSTVAAGTRFNSNKEDLNRNYPLLVSGFSSSIQAETRAMMDLADSLSFVMSANIHTGEECVNYPFDLWTSTQRKHADHYWWQYVSHEYADTARFYSPPNYMNPSGQSFNNGVTHGGDWYVVSGSRQDYMNYYARQRELTLELAKTKSLTTSELPGLWNYNYRSLINYMYQAIYGIHGVVRDRAANQNLFASIELLDYDDDVSAVFTSLAEGIFYRPLLEGVYDLKVEAEGYLPHYYHGLEVRDRETLFLDVDMGRLHVDAQQLVFEPTVASGSSFKTIFVSNTGDEALSITLDAFTGDPVFFYNIATKTGINIPPGGKESIELWFSSSETGQYAGELFFTLGLPRQPQMSLPLSGSVLAEASLIYAVNPQIEFGEVAVNQSHTLNLSIGNTGNIPLEISDALITNEAFSLDGSPPYTLNAGDFMDIPVVFSPDIDATFTATLQFESNASNQIEGIELRGQGIDNTWVNDPHGRNAFARIIPNPTIPYSYLELLLDTPGPVVLQLYDAQGRKLLSKYFTFLDSGSYRWSLENITGYIDPGLYYLRIVSNKKSETIRFIKITP